jgi:hypothetical protein
MKPDLDIDAFLRAERIPAPDSEAHKDEVRDRLEVVLGPLATLGAGATHAPAAASHNGAASSSSSALMQNLARYKAYVFMAGGIAIGFSARTAFDAARSHPASGAQLQNVTLTAPAASASSAQSSVIDGVPERDVESLPLSPLPSAQAPSPSSGPLVRSDNHDKSDLAAESLLLQTAQTALERGEPDRALVALERHRQKFPDGQLSEERESLTIYALVAEGKLDEARAKTAAFHLVFRNSLQGPALDALTTTAP